MCLAVTALVLAAVEVAAAALGSVPVAESALLVAIAWAAYTFGARPALGCAALVLGYGVIRAWASGGSMESAPIGAAGLAGVAAAGSLLALMGGLHRRRAPREEGSDPALPSARWAERLIDEVDAVLWEADVEAWRFTFVSARAEEMFGHPVDRWLESADFWVGLIHADDRQRVLSQCRESIRQGRSHQSEYRMVAASGEVLWVRDIVHVGTGPGEGARMVRGVIVDITDQRREMEFQASQRKTLEMIASGEPLEKVLDHLARSIEGVVAGSRCLATRLSEDGSRLAVVSAPSIRDASGRPIHGLEVAVGQASCGSAAACRERIVSGDVSADPMWEGLGELARSLRIGAAWSQPVFSSARELLGTFCILKEEPSTPGHREIQVLESAASLAGIAMGREQDEREMRRSLSLLRATLESTADGILVVDTSGSIVSFNQRFLDLWRVPRELIEAGNDDRALAFVLDQLSDPQGFLEKVRDLYSRPSEESFDLLEFRDGRVFERYSRPQMVGDRCAGRVWSFRDITDRKRAEGALQEREAQLRHAQKMEAVGRLAGGVAHDFNNLLTAITGYSDIVLRALSSNDPIRSRIREIRKASESATALTRQLLTFSRKQILQLQVLDLNQVVEETSSLLRRTIGEDVELVISTEEDLGRVRGDRGQLEQVLVNLAVNARDAMPGGGKLIVETAQTRLDETYARKHTDVLPGQYVVISVSDTGEGMDSETRSRIFEPFFTTKEMGRGTGLGLATVYGIVKQSEGNIWVYSEPGHGTTFKIYLPVVDECEEDGRDTTAPQQIPAGSGRVLLVEDDEGVRSLVAIILKESGYTVVEAHDGADGLEAFQGPSGPFDLIVTDVVMPRMSGKEMAERILAGNPETRILFISGYTQTAVQHHGLLEGGSNFLQKPFSPKDLALKVQALMEQPAAV